MIETAAAAPRRAHCPNCLRAQAGCICHWVRPLGSVCEVLILQHPLEVGHAKGSARLLHLSLPGSRMVTGEVFAEEHMQHLLYQPWRPAAFGATEARQPELRNANGDLASGPQPILLYPEFPGPTDMAAVDMAAPDAARATPPPADTARWRLVVLDATWRKSRKMLHLNPQLQVLPRLSLDAVPASRYAIRKAHRADQLSTLEASCYALMQIEGRQAPYLELLAAFDGFVAQQLAYGAHKRLRDG